jgi:mxaK protein
MNRILHLGLRVLAGMIIACVAVLAWQVFEYRRLTQLEQQLVKARSSAALDQESGPEAKLARAQLLARTGGPGAADSALDLYRQVEAEGSDSLRRLARFDTANLYLRQALAESAGGESGRAVPLVELAKGIYRTLLRDDPEDWDLRYNLERALRLLPEEDPDAADLIQAAPENMESAPTTLRGTSMGLP